MTKLSHYLSYMLGGKYLNFTALCSEMGGFVAIEKQQAWLPLTKAQSNPEPFYYEVTEQITASCFLKLLRFGYFKGQSQIIWEDQGFILNSPQCVVARMQLLPPVTRCLGCRDFLCYARRRKQEGTMLGVRKGVRKGCQRLCSAQILSVPEPILCDWCHTSPQQFVPRRCHTYWVSGANDTISHAPYLQYHSETQEALLFHRDTCTFLKNKSCYHCRINNDITFI